MNFDEFLKVHTDCARAWCDYDKKPGTFDQAFGDLKQAVAEIKCQPTLSSDPRCVAMIEWFEKLEQLVREKRRLRDKQERKNARRRWERHIKETGDTRFFEGGDCSGNAR